ncbi:MAG: hypothetical protein WC867_01450 [Candidatus Pacearchaeota archaeon]|jgi:hypothetical protein
MPKSDYFSSINPKENEDYLENNEDKLIENSEFQRFSSEDLFY